MAKWPTKDPDAVLDYTVNWTEWLGDDRIDTSTWIIPAGLTKDSDSHNGLEAIVWLSGGTAGDRYEVTNRITTTGGRTDDRTVSISVSEK